jgi:hypothetical protein
MPPSSPGMTTTDHLVRNYERTQACLLYTYTYKLTMYRPCQGVFTLWSVKYVYNNNNNNNNNILLTASGLLPGGSGHLTHIQNMRLV